MEDDIQDEVMMVVLGLLLTEKPRTKKKNRIWKKAWRQRARGLYSPTSELEVTDRQGFQGLLRMSAEEFDYVLHKVAPLITKKNTRWRLAITAKERLALTLRYLATGESFASLSFHFRFGESTISMIVIETCKALHQTLRDEYLKTPTTVEEWLDVAKDFHHQWQFNHCLGAIDGKHIMILPPAHSGSTFRNYKGRFSVLMMAVVDARYMFRYISVGAQNRASDAGVFPGSDFEQALDSGLLNLPAADLLPGSDIQAPYVFLGDNAYPLRLDLMKPYASRQMDHQQRVFNYRLSRAHRVVENGFGIWENRWRVFHNPILLNPDKVQKMVFATVCLHNYLCAVRSDTYAPPGLTDTEDENHRPVDGTWRADGLGAMLPLQPGRCGNSSMAAKALRDDLKSYFVTPAGRVPWQDDYI
ncbi:protein ALP1-like [Melanotaenia boesemani]|uniref:protein ALP1-like n=1 Tax=Melanotaenia boesemani TaxID=1250792 RepID=UPI001C04E6A9|nr:protein ALP1-like [Melanotaenia boesemani]